MRPWPLRNCMPYAGNAHGRYKQDMGAEREISGGVAGDPLDRFEYLLRACLRYLERSVDKDALEPILVRHLLVEACGAYEKTIRGAIDLRMVNSDDKEFVRYLGKAAERYDMPFGTVPTWRFTEILEMPDTAGISLAKEAKKTYHRLVQDRNSVAHGGETDIPLCELQHMHEMAKSVPLAFVAALRLRFGQDI